MTKEKIYIIPGLGESCELVRYQNLAKSLTRKGHEVLLVSPDWYQPLSTLVFEVDKNATIIGFSFGSVIAYLIAKQRKYKRAIFCSMSPINTFTYESLIEDYSKYMTIEKAEELSRDVKKITIDLNSIDTPFINIVGGEEKDILEHTKADIIIPKTEHYMSKRYIETISSLF